MSLQSQNVVVPGSLSASKKLVRRAKRWAWGVRHRSMAPTLFYLASPDTFARWAPTPRGTSVDQTSKAAVSEDLVPARIFQTWKSRTDIPQNYQYWRASFANLNPDYEILLWDDDDNRALITDHFSWFLPIYNAYPKEIFRADAVRPFFLFLRGGFYADMDSECLRSLDPLRGRGDVVLGRMGADEGFEHSIPNALMASKPNQLFWLLVIAMMIERATAIDRMIEYGPETFTGPIVLKDAVDFYRGGGMDRVLSRCQPVIDQLPEDIRSRIRHGAIELLAPDLWYPVDWTNPFHRMLRSRLLRTRKLLDLQTARRLFPEAYLVTYWSHSW